MKWEYYGIHLDMRLGPFMAQLRFFGEEGWEAVGVAKDMLLLKRPHVEEVKVVPESTPEEKCAWIRQLAEEGMITPAKAAVLEERYGTKIL